MEDDYISLSKWDLERIVGSMGGVSAYDRQYYKYDTRIEGAHGYNRDCICIFYDASADEPIFYSIRYSYDEYTDEITIHEVEDNNRDSPFTYYRVFPARSRQVTEYY